MRSLALALVAAVCAAAAAPLPAANAKAEATHLFLVAQTLTQEGAYGEARQVFEELIEIAPEEPYVRLEYAELLFRLRLWAEAAEQATVARRLAPENLSVLRLYGQSQLKLAEDDPAALDRARDAFEDIRGGDSGSDLESMVALGQIYLTQNRLADAADLFEELLEERPGDRMLLSFFADALQRVGDDARLEAALTSYLETDPGFVKARMTLAELLSRRRDHAGAVRTLRNADADDRKDPEYLRLLAVELYRNGESEASLVEIEKLLAADPDAGGARYLQALVLADLGRNDEAEAQLRALLEEDRENLEVHLILAQVLERQERSDEAAELLARAAGRLEARGRKRQADEARLQLAQLHARAGFWESVLEDTDGLAGSGRAGPAAEATLLRAEALAKLGRGEQAIALLDEIGGEDLLSIRALAKGADILFEMERPEAGRARLSRLASDSEVDSLMLAAEVYQRHDLHGDAIPVLQRAIEQRPDSLQAHFWLGAAYERTERRGEAETHFRRVLEIDPEFAPAMNYLGYMWAERGENLAQALDLVQRAVALDPENGAYVDSLGWAYFQLGRFEEARGHLERAAELVPDDAVVYEHLGDLYRAVGDEARAREIYRRALTLGGDNRDAVERKLEELGGSL